MRSGKGTRLFLLLFLGDLVLSEFSHVIPDCARVVCLLVTWQACTEIVDPHVLPTFLGGSFEGEWRMLCP